MPPSDEKTLMRIFLHEFVTGGGMYSLLPDEPPSGSLLDEGSAMVRALAEDFSRLDSTDVTVLRDQRLVALDFPKSVQVVDVGSEEQEREFIAKNAEAADWTVVIAPEFDELLLQRVKQVEECGSQIASPNSVFVEATQNKHATAITLRDAGIPMPDGEEIQFEGCLSPDIAFPAVLKPLLGAGSTNTMLVDSASTMPTIRSGDRFRIEEFCSGVVASVSVLCGPTKHFVLPATHQYIKDDSTFGYLGGRIPLPQPLRMRAERLALNTVQSLPRCIGYVGIDMILAEAGDQRDVVIEVNPRLTTSYIGLRELARCNLAQAMLDVAQGKQPNLSFGDGPVEFLADGTIVSK